MILTEPEKVTLGTWYAGQNCIFDYLINTAKVSYLDAEDEDMMQFLLLSMFSQRTVRPFMLTLSSEQVAMHVDTLYSHVWEKDYEIFSTMLELEGEAVTTVKDDTQGDTDRTSSTNQMNKTSGFNSEEMVDDSGADIAGTDNVKNVTSHTQKSSNVTTSGLLSKAAAVRKRQFHQRLCKDIAEIITLSTY